MASNVTLVTCTLGEEGEVLVPAFAGIAADKADQLGGWRIHELEEACRALGVTDHRFLGGAGKYRDSGMMETPANDNPRCFWRADMAEAVGLLVEVIREVKPQVVVTYDDFGGYGHPDHIQAHRVTVQAVEQTRDIVQKLYYTAVPRSFIEATIKAMKEQGHEFFFGIESAEDAPFARTRRPDYRAGRRARLPRRERSRRCGRTRPRSRSTARSTRSRTTLARRRSASSTTC